MAKDNKTIGKFKLTGIKRAPRGVPQIEVTFDLDTNGILKVSARDLGTGRAQEITISSSSNLSEDEIQQAIRDAQQYAQADSQRKEAMEVRNQAETLVMEVKEAFRVCGSSMNRQDRNQIKNDLSNLERLVHKHKPEKMSPEALPELKSAMDQLRSSSAALMQLYANHQQTQS